MTLFAEHEQSVLELFPESATWQEESGLLLVRGPRCSGKTTLLNRISESASASGALILWATGCPSEQELSHGVLHQVLDQMAQQGEAVEQSIGRVSFGSDGMQSLADVRDRIYRRFVDTAATRPVLIAVDDINYVDQPSLDFLRFLARRLKATRIRLALAERTGQTLSSCDCLRTDVLRLPYTRVIRLGLLSREGLARWLGEQAVVARAPDAAAIAMQVADRVHDLSGGNFFLAGLLLAKYLATAEEGGSEVTADADFYDAVRIMIDDSDVPGFRRGARAAAVLGRLSSEARLARLLGGDFVLADRVLRALEDLGVMQGTCLRQEVGRALIEDRNFTERAEARRAAARVLFEDGVAVEHVVRNLTAAGGLGAPWDASLALELVDRMFHCGQLDLAGDLLKLVRASAITADACGALELRLLRTAWLTDPVLAAALVPPLVAAARRGALGQADVAFLARATTLHGYPDEAGELMSLLRADRPEPCARGEVMLAEVLCRLWQGLPPQWSPAGVHGLGAGEESGPLLMHGQTWLSTVLHKIPDLLERGDRQGTIDAAEQILEGIRVRTSGLEPFLSACWALDAVNALPVARRWCVSLTEALDDHPSREWKAHLLLVQARISAALGDLAGAYRLLQQTLSHKSWREWGVKTGSLAALLVEVLTEMGRYQEVSEVLDRPVPSTAFQGLEGLLYIRARGRHHLAVGRSHAAMADFENCRDAAAALNISLPLLLPWRADLAEAHLHLGNVQAARRLLKEQLSLLPEEATAVRGAALRLFARSSRPDQRVGLLTMSADHLELCGNRLQLGYTLGELAFAYRETSRLELARTTMRRAQRLAQQCDALGLQRVITSQTTAGVAREDEPEELTEWATLSSAERRVALLAVQGFTNREISARLFITPSTVEQHLTRTYRKLRVRHREHLEDRFSSVLVNVGTTT